MKGLNPAGMWQSSGMALASLMYSKFQHMSLKPPLTPEPYKEGVLRKTCSVLTRSTDGKISFWLLDVKLAKTQPLESKERIHLKCLE